MTLTSMKSLNHNTSSVKYLKPIIYFSWVDAQTIGGSEWMEMSETKKYSKTQLPVMYTVGFLIHEDANQYVVASTVGPAETSQIHKIPKCMILHQEILLDRIKND